MDAKHFHLSDHEPEARLARLPPSQLAALETALSKLSAAGDIRKRAESDQEALPLFLLPLAEFGMTGEQMIRMTEKVPDDFPFDHRNIYFDFRLGVWIKHIEPPTVSECLEEYFENAESPEQGLAYLREKWQAFLRRHGAG